MCTNARFFSYTKHDLKKINKKTTASYTNYRKKEIDQYIYIYNKRLKWNTFSVRPRVEKEKRLKTLVQSIFLSKGLYMKYTPCLSNISRLRILVIRIKSILTTHKNSWKHGTLKQNETCVFVAPFPTWPICH